MTKPVEFHQFDTFEAQNTGYNSYSGDAAGYPYGEPGFPLTEIPMAQTAYGADFAGLGAPPHPHHHHHHGGGGGGWGRGGWGGGGWGWDYPYYQPFSVVILDEDTPEVKEKKKKAKAAEEKKAEADDAAVAGLAAFGLEQIITAFSPQERKLISDEMKSSAAFKAHILRLLQSGDPVANIKQSALRAVANEFDPGSFPMMKGLWMGLREVARSLAVAAKQDIERRLASMTPAQKLAAAEAIMEAGGMSGMGAVVAPASTGDIIGSILSTIAGTAASVYTAQLAGKTQVQIAQAQAEATAKAAAAQQQIAQAQLAMQQAASRPGTPGAAGGAGAGAGYGGGESGIPSWALPVGLVGLGLGVLAFFMMRRGK